MSLTAKGEGEGDTINPEAIGTFLLMAEVVPQSENHALFSQQAEPVDKHSPSPSRATQSPSRTTSIGGIARRESNQPPKKPIYAGLPVSERNNLRRKYEKAMSSYVKQHGTVSLDPCGPCFRTKTECIVHPCLKKCMLCFRGHDICEKWDESVISNNRRRVNCTPKSSKKTEKVYMLNGMY